MCLCFVLGYNVYYAFYTFVYMCLMKIEFWIQCFMGGCNVLDTMFYGWNCEHCVWHCCDDLCQSKIHHFFVFLFTIVQRERSILINVDTQSVYGWMLDALMPRGLERKLSRNVQLSISPSLTLWRVTCGCRHSVDGQWHPGHCQLLRYRPGIPFFIYMYGQGHQYLTSGAP